MNAIILDSDVFIDHQRKKNSHFQRLINTASQKGYQLFIPTVIIVEIFVGYELLVERELVRTEKLLKNFNRVPLTDDIAKLAAKIGREQKLGFVGAVDLVVAATALTLDAELATNNKKHFQSIPNLKLFNFKRLL